MKKLRIILFALLFTLLIGAFTACGSTKYRLHFETNGGTEMASVQLAAGKQIGELEEPIKDNHVFAGWFMDEDFQTAFTPETKMPKNDMTVYAAWTPEQSVRITFNTMGGSAVAQQFGKVGSAHSAPQAPTKEGYAFLGWFVDEECTQAYTFTVYPQSNLTLYAGWGADTAYAYFTYYGNGKLLTVQPVAVGESLQAPALFESDIVSDGWYLDEDRTQPFTFTGEVSESQTLYTTYYTRGLQFEGETLTGYNGTSKAVIVPDQINGTKITAIRDNAFYSQSIVSVSLPDCIERVGASAFNNCQYLDNINLTQNVTEIGAYAFHNNVRLTSYGDITSVIEIPEGLFLGCEKLRAITLSSETVSVGTQAFADCVLLTSFVLPNGVKAVSDGVFSGCSALESVTLPTEMQSFGTRVFDGCAALTEIQISGNDTFKVEEGALYQDNVLLRYAGNATTLVIPATVERIAMGAFGENATLENLTVESAVIERGAFEGMSKLQTLTLSKLGGEDDFLAYYFGAEKVEKKGIMSSYIPASLRVVTLTVAQEQVNDYAFYGATGLQEIVGIENVTSVGEGAFAYTALTSFTVNKNLATLAKRAFEGCNSLTKFVVDSENTRFALYDDAIYENGLESLYLVPVAKTEFNFPEQLRTVQSNAFVSSIASEITLPDSITTMEQGAFTACHNLDKLTVPFLGDGNANEYMGYTFGTTMKLEYVDGEYQLKTENMANLPASLKSLTVKKGYAKIPQYAFAHLIHMTELNLNEDTVIAEYGDYSFYKVNLSKWDFTGATKIGTSAFEYSMLIEVELPGTLSGNLKENAFASLENVEKITLGEGITQIPERLFYGNIENSYDGNGDYVEIPYSSMNDEILIPSTVKTIGAQAFYGLGKSYDGEKELRNEMFSIRFAENSQCTSIGGVAFAETGLQTIAIPASVTTLGQELFYNCSFLERVTVGTAEEGSSLKTVEILAFADCAKLTSVTFYGASIPTMNVYNSGTQFYHAFIRVVVDEAGNSNIVYKNEALNIYVPASLVDGYKSATGWKEVAENIKAIQPQGGQV